MSFSPKPSPPGSTPSLEQLSGEIWTPLYHHTCSFPPEIFRQVMLNLIRNPNINSNHLFRADISLECPLSEYPPKEPLPITPRIVQFINFTLQTVIIRTMIPRNPLVDKPLDQTCLFYQQTKEETGEINSLVIYLPHISTPSESPFYHPSVHGIAFLHTFTPSLSLGEISIHYSFFPSSPRSPTLERTALHLLSVLHKHGQGQFTGYVKKVKHDQILPQSKVQNTYSLLKAKYGRKLCQGWVEDTDPGKHVFEDLGIAAFLIELWKEIYEGREFPGFVDIGCGNGLLVHILIEEGYDGWGFDARRRKSWVTYSTKAQENLKEMVLIPSVLQPSPESGNENENNAIQIHNGLFPTSPFIISNHADELTPWTPLLATLSNCPFLTIPCCSHSLSGARFRAPPPNQPGISNSAYSSLVVWIEKLIGECGWKVEKEMLRIPSTRNTALIGRFRIETPNDDQVENEVLEIVEKYGGAEGWLENAMKLVKGGVRGH